MLSHLEVELKQLISLHHYHQLLVLFPNHEVIHQVNHYFRYDDDLERIACRIRVLNKTCTLTFKQKHTQGVMEYNFPVLKADASVFELPEVKQFLDDKHLSETWSYIGALETIRHLALLAQGELCIDKNRYLNQIDYELEYETTLDKEKEATDEFMKLLNSLSIEYQPAPSKFERFLSLL
jgi:uncharacterized protein YjbK